MILKQCLKSECNVLPIVSFSENRKTYKQLTACHKIRWLKLRSDLVAVIELNHRRSNRYVEDFVIELRPKIVRR
jgi:hypothetical protein